MSSAWSEVLLVLGFWRTFPRRHHVTSQCFEFAYSPDRKGEHPQSHLSNFTGTLQADGCAGFDRIHEAGRVQEAACWAHVRRKFYDFEVAHKSPVAPEALQRIAALFAIEKEIRGRPPDERREVRNTRGRPLLESASRSGIAGTSVQIVVSY